MSLCNLFLNINLCSSSPRPSIGKFEVPVNIKVDITQWQTDTDWLRVRRLSHWVWDTLSDLSVSVSTQRQRPEQSHNDPFSSLSSNVTLFRNIIIIRPILFILYIHILHILYILFYLFYFTYFIYFIQFINFINFINCINFINFYSFHSFYWFYWFYVGTSHVAFPLQGM